MKYSILIGPSSFGEKNSGPLQTLKKRGFKVIKNPYGRKIKKKELIKLLNEEVIGLIAGLETLDDEVLTCSHLKVVSRVGSGVSNIDVKSLKKNKIKLFSIPNGPTVSVSEATVANIINLFRHTLIMSEDLHNKKWKRQIGNQLKDKNILIIGFGKIGRAIAKLLKPFQVKIMVYDPYLKSNSKMKYKKVGLEKGLKSADLITIHSSGNKCILGKDEFKIMKKGVLICNAARGEIIDEKQLIKALKNGTVSGGWLDTFHEEPYVGPLSSFKQLILTPHIGSYTKECRESMEQLAVNSLVKSLV
jgi:D-3-phosphoglycerate dehydrogenase